MSYLLDQIASLLECSPVLVQYKLRDLQQRIKVERELRLSKLQTTYNDRNGFRHTFFFEGLTKQGADQIPAYGKLRRPFNVSVAAHFYARHRIMLKYPQLPCVIEKDPTAGNKFYPLELLVKIDDEGPVPSREDTPIPNYWLPTLSSPSIPSSSISFACSRRRSRATSIDEDDNGDHPPSNAHEISVWLEGGGGGFIKDVIWIERSEIDKICNTRPLNTRAPETHTHPHQELM